MIYLLCIIGGYCVSHLSDSLKDYMESQSHVNASCFSCVEELENKSQG